MADEADALVAKVRHGSGDVIDLHGDDPNAFAPLVNPGRDPATLVAAALSPDLSLNESSSLLSGRDFRERKFHPSWANSNAVVPSS